MDEFGDFLRVVRADAHHGVVLSAHDIHPEAMLRVDGTQPLSALHNVFGDLVGVGVRGHADDRDRRIVVLGSSMPEVETGTNG
ncbi:hypothetical protein [Nocardia abscessus]|uniref:hypothetical protein n=1 Tax=Nocardia abscessus TaxID=120957 RepID=UPI0034D40C18